MWSLSTENDILVKRCIFSCSIQVIRDKQETKNLMVEKDSIFIWKKEQMASYAF